MLVYTDKSAAGFAPWPHNSLGLGVCLRSLIPARSRLPRSVTTLDDFSPPHSSVFPPWPCQLVFSSGCSPDCLQRDSWGQPRSEWYSPYHCIQPVVGGKPYFIVGSCMDTDSPCILTECSSRRPDHVYLCWREPLCLSIHIRQTLRAHGRWL